MQNKNALIGGTGIVVGLITFIVGYVILQPNVSGTLEPEEEMTHEEIDAENLEKTEEGLQTDGASETESADAEQHVYRGPTISVSPYTVYIGFAEEYDATPEFPSGEVNEVVVGYEWEALPGSQMFDSVVLPAWEDIGAPRYQVYVWDIDDETGRAALGSEKLLGTYAAGGEVEFPREGFVGATRFKVTGIDPTLRVCPNDRSFNWEARFTFEGRMGLVRTPITESLPAGEMCEMR